MMDTILEVPELGFETAQKIIQQQLVLILHAHSCQQKETLDAYDSDGSDDSSSSVHEIPAVKKCQLPFCEKTKNCLDHIRGCYDAEQCVVPHCHATREIIRHWKSCNKKSLCSICKPIFRAQIKNVL